jgi:hypothetical protein
MIAARNRAAVHRAVLLLATDLNASGVTGLDRRAMICDVVNGRRRGDPPLPRAGRYDATICESPPAVAGGLSSLTPEYRWESAGMTFDLGPVADAADASYNPRHSAAIPEP